MQSIEAAILRTILYADVFNFPLTVEEIHYFLIHHEPTSLAQIEKTLTASVLLRRLLIADGGYIARNDRSGLIEQRLEREQASACLWPQAVRCGVWLARLPYVRMVAVTGALAVRNAAHANDDLDYMVVTAPNRVWLARAIIILLVRFARLRGVTICPNYVLSENAFKQSKQDLFIAHEITQMAFLYGHTLFEQFLAENAWTNDYLPNATSRYAASQEYGVGGLWSSLKQQVEKLLNGRVGDTLERWEYQRKLKRFAPDLQTPHSAARLDEQQVKGHFNDYGFFVLRQYEARLREYGLIGEMALPATGD